MDKVNLSNKLAQFSAYWQPKIVGELNGQQVMLFEPATTLNTGNVRNERTVEELERL